MVKNLERKDDIKIMLTVIVNVSRIEERKGREIGHHVVGVWAVILHRDVLGDSWRDPEGGGGKNVPGRGYSKAKG